MVHGAVLVEPIVGQCPLRRDVDPAETDGVLFAKLPSNPVRLSMAVARSALASESSSCSNGASALRSSGTFHFADSPAWRSSLSKFTVTRSEIVPSSLVYGPWITGTGLRGSS